MMRVVRRYRFSASHRLHTEALSEQQNRELYGKCNHPFGHGHDYVVEIGVRGPVDPASGRTVDPAKLDRLVEDEILRVFDHKSLEADVPGFASVVPTTENLAVNVLERLSRRWDEVAVNGWPKLDKVRIGETKRNFFEITPNYEE